MEELIEKVEDVIDALDESSLICDLKKEQEELMKDEKLLKKISEYKSTRNELLKEEILQNTFYRDYKEMETNCNFLIWEINQRLKKIVEKEKHCL